MNELKIIKVAEIRKKLATIPGKIVLAALLVIGVLWLQNGRDIDAVWAKAMEEYLFTGIAFVVVYGIVSYVFFFIKLIGNWLIGVLAAAAVVAIAYSQLDRLDTQMQLVVIGIMLFGGPVMDLFRVVHYFSLRSEVIHAQEEKAQQAYGRGYDQGYSQGYDRAISERRERQSRISGREAARMRGSRRDYIEDYYDDYGDESYYEDSRYIENRHGRGYEDSYDGGYDGYYDENYDEDYDESYDEGFGRGRSAGYDQEDGQATDWDAPAPGFFGDCADEAAIKRRYRDLCKVYHPDAGNGSADIFYEITQQYNELMRP